MPKYSVRVHLVCMDLPETPQSFEASRFGMQDKNREIMSGTELASGDCLYSFELTVAGQAGGIPSFGGHFAHGTKSDRFLYLSQLGLRESEWTIIKRIKIPLKEITWKQIQAVVDDSGNSVLEATVSGQGMATVSLKKGWTVVRTNQI